MRATIPSPGWKISADTRGSSSVSDSSVARTAPFCSTIGIRAPDQGGCHLPSSNKIRSFARFRLIPTKRQLSVMLATFCYRMRRHARPLNEQPLPVAPLQPGLCSKTYSRRRIALSERHHLSQLAQRRPCSLSAIAQNRDVATRTGKLLHTARFLTEANS
jgi:hypothetical protein